VNTKGRRGFAYECKQARPGHGPASISEAKLLPWVKREAGRFRVPADAVETTDSDARRAELEDQRRAVGDALVVRAYTPAEAAAKVEAIEAELEALDAMVDVSSLVDVPQAINWDEWTPGDVNTVLRTYWREIKLDAAMQPVKAEWKIPAEFVA
jgi:hypothetical protein